ncbi:cytochrome P450 [Mycobacterium sp. 050128]|uniref:cytochrome P450 n=1 Tax=Mycobacterium sp. 050128 TaxID=3096112 RepID=UPI002EDAFB47
MSIETGIASRPNGTPPPEVPLAEVQLESLDFWVRNDDLRDAAFATLRREAPISFWSPIQYEGFETGNGYWALTKLDDVHFASRHPDIFSSASGITVNDQTPELAEYFGSMIVMDDPRHQRLRSIVSRAFTPKVVARIEASVQERAHRLVTSLTANHPDGQADLVTELAGPLPLQVICDMMGIPEEDHQRIFHWTNVILGFGDPDLTLDFEEFMQVSMDIGAYATALADDRRSNHHDDLTTALVEAEVDGDRLSSQEIASFFILLVVAGNETTRNAISHGVLALSRFPEQRDRWWSDFEALTPTAVEEIVRWASPVVYMRRTLTRDFELSGVKMAEGDKVALYYNSANRDESRFDNPWAFDVARNPNPHLGFGGGGAHFCLGANLARREIRVVFDELRREIPDITVTGKPARLLSQFIHGIKTLPVSWTTPS